MSSIHGTPAQSDKIRPIFERAHAQGNHLLTTTIKTNDLIKQLQVKALIQGADQLNELKPSIEAIQLQLGQAASEADTRGEGSWTDYFRALSHAMFTEEMVLAPLYFSDRKYHTQRQEFTDGLYGMAGMILEKALSEYDDPHATDDQRGHLRGVINEQSFLGLINRHPQTGTFAALPANVTEDLLEKTDATYWCFDKKGQAHSYNIQVKSSLPSNERATPAQGFIVAATHFGNSDLWISRAILKELAGMPLDDDTRNRLDQSERALQSYINQQIKERFAVTTLEQGKQRHHTIARHVLSHTSKRSAR